MECYLTRVRLSQKYFLGGERAAHVFMCNAANEAWKELDYGKPSNLFLFRG